MHQYNTMIRSYRCLWTRYRLCWKISSTSTQSELPRDLTPWIQFASESRMLLCRILETIIIILMIIIIHNDIWLTWRKSLLTSRTCQNVDRGALADIRLKRTISGTAQSWDCIWMTPTMMMMWHVTVGCSMLEPLPQGMHDHRVSFAENEARTRLAVEADRRFRRDSISDTTRELVGEVTRRQSVEASIDQHRQFVVDSLGLSKPVQITEEQCQCLLPSQCFLCASDSNIFTFKTWPTPIFNKN